jgi:hypothetical protein
MPREQLNQPKVLQCSRKQCKESIPDLISIPQRIDRRCHKDMPGIISKFPLSSQHYIPQ